MSEPGRRSFFVMAALLLLGPRARAAESAAPSSSSPEATVKEFYRWYVEEVKADRYPLKDGKPTLRKYVTAPLIARLEKLDASPDGMDSDYFLQAQDYADDWGTAVSVTDSRIEHATATLVVILGAGDFRRRLRIGLMQTAGAWKIRRIEPMKL